MMDATTDVADAASLLPHGTGIAVSGEDAESFLQGQISQDLGSVLPERARPACLNSPKGRVIATLVVVRRAEGFVLLTAPDVRDTVEKRLRMYVLRARVRLEALSTGGLAALPQAAAEVDALAARFDAGLPEAAWAVARPQDGITAIRAPGSTPRWWLLGEPLPAPSATTASAFAAGDIACGLPCVGAVQAERHVAQHLGLDRLGALSFDKGCYTGQEVIARIHYRGGVNRLPMRLQTTGAPPAPNTALLDADGAAVAEVVNAAAGDNGCEVLAVHRGRDLPHRLWLEDGRALERRDFEALQPHRQRPHP